jgi:hypothetical protein
MIRIRALVLWGLATPIVVGSCSSDPKPRGGLMLMIGSDGPLPIDRLQVHVEAQGRTLHNVTYDVPDEAPLPTTLAIVSNGDSTASVNIGITGWQGFVPLDRRDAIVTQVPSDRVAALTILLSGRCTAKVELDGAEARSTCGTGSTCDPNTGDCVSAEVDASMLPTYATGAENQLEGAAGENNGGVGAAGPGGAGQVEPGVGGQGGNASIPVGGSGGTPESSAGAGGEVSTPSGCVADDADCNTNEDCCSGTCAGTCTPLNATCKTAGNPCEQNGDCCSKYCDPDKKCSLASSYCVQPGDACLGDDDCCTGSCDVANGAPLGMCVELTATVTGCNGRAGTVCSDCSDCCSRQCVAFGQTGIRICAPSNGCRATGELCLEDTDCCGGQQGGLPGDGNIFCDKEPGASFGLCRNPVACNPQGNVCQYSNYECGLSAQRNNCCNALGGSGTCEIDAFGVPRCNGLADNCRITGETCSSSADCCSPGLCVPDVGDVLRCTAQTCQVAGATCTGNADCCVGTQCNRPLGAIGGICEAVAGQTCALYGQSCNVATDCCEAIPCTNDRCMYPFE